MADTLDLKGEFLAGFVAEAEDYLDASHAALARVTAALEAGRREPGAVRQLFRALHTIKGLAGMVGVEPVERLAHAGESLLREADTHGGALEPEMAGLVDRTLHLLERQIRALGRGAAPETPPTELLSVLESARSRQASSPTDRGGLDLPAPLDEKLAESEVSQIRVSLEQGGRAFVAEFVPRTEWAEAGWSITRIRSAVEEVAELVRVLPVSRQAAPGGLAFLLILVGEVDAEGLQRATEDHLGEIHPLTAAAPVAAEQPPTAEPMDEDLADDEVQAPQPGVVRVEVDRLDEAMDGLSALVVSRFRLERQVQALRAQGVDVRGLEAGLADHRRQLRDLRASILRARMVPLDGVLARVPLLVRGLARRVHKQVALELATGEAELDKAVAERAFPALVHLIRNAVDHGLEAPAERERAGKDPSGHLRVEASQLGGGLLEVRVSDDGAGVDPERVAAKAGAPVPRDDRGLLDLLTRPGLSTREAVSATSGRGMGMDIVRRVVEEDLGGELLLENRPGAGATFRLRLPLTVTILDVLYMRCGEQTFVVPVASVEELVEVRPEAVSQVPRPKARRLEARMLRHRGSAVPLYDLAHLLGLPRTGGPSPKAVLTRVGASLHAFAVDALLGEAEVVIRPLVDPLANAPGVVATTDLGDGLPTLVLDLPGLHQALAGGGGAS